ncbi:MAG: hypothetical protein Q9225_004407 [Loekoesia sp. 1 TL-2023]
MPLTIIQFPRDQVRSLKVIHAVQAASESPVAVRIQKKGLRVLRIIHNIEGVRQYPTVNASMASSILSGVATGQEASFPSSMYLRKRYKKLQRCTVSRNPSVQSRGRASPTHSPIDPSFQAIRALNGQPETIPEPVIVHALVEDANGGLAGDIKALSRTPSNRVNDTPQLLASLEHGSQSFSARVDRLVQAIDLGRTIRFQPSDDNGPIQVFATVTTPEVGYGEDAAVEYSRKRTDTPLISVAECQGLQNRIRDRIAESAAANQRDSISIVARHERHAGVDPRKLYTHGRDGVRCHIISPIPLDYHKPRSLTTPSIRSSGTVSDLSSPLGHTVAAHVSGTKNPAYSTRSEQSASATAGGNPWFPEISPSEVNSSLALGGRPRKGKDDQPDRQEKNLRIVSWLRRVKEALSPHSKFPARKPGRAVGVFQDKSSSSSDRWPGAPVPRPENVLRDLTNIRQPGYLEKNSFAQTLQKEPGKKAKVQNSVKAQPAVVTVHPSAQSYVQVNWPQAELHSKSAGGKDLIGARTALRGHVVTDSPITRIARSGESSRASTVKPSYGQEELHPDVAFALARLEGRAPPPPASPILRRTDDAGLYSPDVEIELGRLRLNCPKPLRPNKDSTWTERFEESIDAGFDCALEAPLSPETKTYIESLR